jgi:CHAT domain-containing protein
VSQDRDFVLELDGQPGSYRLHVSSPAGDDSMHVGLDPARLGVDLDMLQAQVLASAATSRSMRVPELERPLREVGQALFDAVFQASAGALFLSSRNEVEGAGGRLRIVLRLHPPELAVLPWELLFSDHYGGYLCRRSPMVRYVDAPEPVRPLTVSPPLRVLGMTALPGDLAALDADTEQRRLQQLLAPLQDRGLISVDWVPGQSWEAAQDALYAGCQVFHFIGHGGFDPDRGEGVIAFADERGRRQLVGASLLAELLSVADPMPRLVVLNSCQTGAGADTDVFSSTAATLVRTVPAVVAMQFAVTDDAAAVFSRAFYQALARNRGVDEAVRAGRIALTGWNPDTLEWVTPVLYLRSRDSRLFDLAYPGASPAGADEQPEPRQEAAVPAYWGARATEESRTRGAPTHEIDVTRVPETSAEPALEQRYLQGRFPERVRLGEVVSLLVRLGFSADDALSSRLRPFPVSAQGTDITLVLLESPGFRPRSQRAALRVFPRRDSDWALFDLKAVTEGVHTLRVLAFAGGTALGELTVQAIVGGGLATSAMAERAAPAGGGSRDPGEVSLVIHYDRDGGVYRYQLIDWSGDVPEEAASNQLLQTPSQAVESLVQQLNALARGAASWDAATTLEWLKGQGIALWRGFIPDALQREFWARRDRITRMTIISSGDPVPWELLYPFSGADHDAGFLIDQFPVARRLGKTPPHRLRVASADLVLSGKESLAAAPGEVRALDALLGAHNIATATIADLSALLRLLRKGGFGLLHFTCHNAFSADAPNASRIMLGSQPFEPVFLEEHAGRFATAAPLVFMNACRTDGQAPLYTTIDGWALSFLRAGAGAFVGSLWEVVDSSAATYAQEFYRAALSGDTLGVAARKAREAIRQEPGDPTWLAYTLYGDPAATVGEQ